MNGAKQIFCQIRNGLFLLFHKIGKSRKLA